MGLALSVLLLALPAMAVSPGVAKELQAFELTNHLKWFTPAEILEQATVNNAELLSWSGPGASERIP